ncbi:MAG: hypothetical protein RMI91_15365 [Gemmatales bacterium]|nr:hypothetical protein [Gemmatales bacterium]
MPKRKRVSTDIQLTDGDCQLCRDMIAMLKDLEHTFKKCEAAGIDVSEQRKARDELLELYEKFASVFLPERSYTSSVEE